MVKFLNVQQTNISRTQLYKLSYFIPVLNIILTACYPEFSETILYYSYLSASTGFLVAALQLCNT